MYWINYVKPISISLVSLALFSAGWYVNGWRWSAKYEGYVKEQKELALKAEQKARDTERDLQAKIDNERTNNEAKVRDINSKLIAALDELRQRPTRSSVPSGASNNKGAKGTELFREDAEFLTREAARADKLAAALEACYASYDAVRAASLPKE